jgi:hypothetical protein
VLEQEEPVQETSKEEEGEAVEEKVKDEDEDGNAGGDEAGDENAVADGEAEEGSSEEEVEEEKPKITVCISCLSTFAFLWLGVDKMLGSQGISVYMLSMLFFSSWPQ